jgi:hypothetical protein
MHDHNLLKCVVQFAVKKQYAFVLHYMYGLYRDKVSLHHQPRERERAHGHATHCIQQADTLSALYSDGRSPQ